MPTRRRNRKRLRKTIKKRRSKIVGGVIELDNYFIKTVGFEGVEETDGMELHDLLVLHKTNQNVKYVFKYDPFEEDGTTEMYLINDDMNKWLNEPSMRDSRIKVIGKNNVKGAYCNLSGIKKFLNAYRPPEKSLFPWSKK